MLFCLPSGTTSSRKMRLAGRFDQGELFVPLFKFRNEQKKGSKKHLKHQFNVSEENNAIQSLCKQSPLNAE